MFQADQPIKSHQEDKLGFVTFAENLGKAVLSFKDTSSIVIGLFGSQGSGKSSLINMALEYIDSVEKSRLKKTKPLIVRFNTWSSSNQLIRQFFQKLAYTFKQTNNTDLKKAGTILESYGDCGEKEQINEILAKQQQKIVIIMEDIERLAPSDVRQVFQLIKSSADFSNTTYLLAFDKKAVFSLLEKAGECSPAEYLEKIIQAPFEVPLISKQAVERLLFNQLTDLTKDIPEDRWIYWENLYYKGLRYFFDNVRDVVRYTNVLRFNYELVQGEVNAADFLALTGLQVFEPEVYAKVRDNKDLFTFTWEAEISSEEKEYYISHCTEIVDKAVKIPKEVLRELLRMLFPKFEAVYGGISYSKEDLADWQRELKLCSANVFDTYFKLSTPEGEISQHEIRTTLSLARRADSFGKALKELKDRDRIIKFIELLEDYADRYVARGDIKNIVTVLMDIGDFFPEGEPEPVINTPIRLLYKFIDNPKERFNIVKKAIEKTKQSLYTIVYLVSDYEPKTTNIEQLIELKNLACSKIEQWAEDGRLKTHRELPYILFRWRKWGLPDKINAFVSDLVDDDNGLIDFTLSFLRKTIVYGTEFIKEDIEDLKKFVDLEHLEARLRSIPSTDKFKKLDDKNKLAIKTFLDTIALDEMILEDEMALAKV